MYKRARTLMLAGAMTASLFGCGAGPEEGQELLGESQQGLETNYPARLVNCSNCTDAGTFLDLNAGATLKFLNVEGGSGGTATLRFSTTSPSGVRTMGVFVNGVKRGTVGTTSVRPNLVEGPTAGISVTLNAGATNTIELRDSEGSAEPDVAYLKVTTGSSGPVCGNGVCQAGESCSSCASDCGPCGGGATRYEAESAVLQSAVKKPLSGASAGQYVDGSNNAYLRWVVDGDGALQTIRIGASSPGGARSMRVLVNNGQVGVLTTSSPSFIWEAKSFSAYLHDGPNYVELTDSEGTAEPDIDYLDVVASTGPVCGNGAVEGSEQCDDGNTTSGDGCSASCQTEAPRLVLVSADWHGPGSMHPAGSMQVDEGSDVGFHFMPNPGYRVARVCAPSRVPYHDTRYTLRNITGNSTVHFAVEYEEITAAAVPIPVTVRPGSTFANPAALVDADVTNTKSLGPSNYAYIDLDLDAYYEITGVEVFEDNGAWEIDQYGIQCWNGSGWDAELFRAASANIVKPLANEHFIMEPSCRTNRARVNFYNDGAVEAFGVKLSGIHRNMFHSTAGSIPLGSYRHAVTGSWVYTEAFLAGNDPYVEARGDGSAQQPWTAWIAVEGVPGSDKHELHGSPTLEGVYVRNCKTGVWTSIEATSYAPNAPELTVHDDNTYSLAFRDREDVPDGFLDPNYDCPLTPRDNATVRKNGVTTTIMAEGLVTFAYVVTHH